MAEIILGVIFAVAGILAGLFTCIALPWASEPNAPKGMVAAPAIITVACLALAAWLFFGG